MWSTSKLVSCALLAGISAATVAPATDLYQRHFLGQSGRQAPTPGFELRYLSPEVHRWYSPRHLDESYLRPWHTTGTRYGEEIYTRYVNQLLEGWDFYDGLGTSLGQGWLVYSWTQQQPQSRGSDIVKWPGIDSRNPQEARVSNRRFGPNVYRSLFNRVVIASDEDGRRNYRLTVGDAIYTMFTPLTFFKPRFNGVRLDVAGERYEGTILLSRPSDPDGLAVSQGRETPGPGDRTNVTHLTGGHLHFDLGGPVSMGLTYVNARNAHTQIQLDSGNPMRGTLTVQQNQTLSTLWIRVSDDSPQERLGGATLLGHDIVLVDTAGQSVSGSEIGFLPRVSGGVERDGALVADGGESILLEYDLASLSHQGLTTRGLRQARVELAVANDFRVESSSNLVTTGFGNLATSVFLPERRAARNVGDKSNARILEIDYGLPTASEIIATDFNIVDWHGLSLQGEIALNRQFRRYPNPTLKRHHESSRSSGAWYLNSAYRQTPATFFLEAFSIEDSYSTTYWLTQRNGTIRYSAPIPEVYELVDDDDDDNGVPEWERLFQDSSRIAWPAYDENADFINDHNQNGNLIPDYEEPFLRFRSDRPEYLFGIDMNHNGTIDRFENDDRPDYPYRRDHRGYNVYLRLPLGPEAAVTAGRQHMRHAKGNGRTHAWYLMGTSVIDRSRLRLRLYDHLARVRDTIADDLIVWVQPVNAEGRMEERPDELPAEDSWSNTLYADLEQPMGEGLRLFHRFKWDWLRQRHGGADLERREGRRHSGFVGVINKAEWSFAAGLGVIEPRVKSEYRREHPFSTRRRRLETLEETLILLWTQPLLAESTGVTYYPGYGRQLFNTELQTGVEWSGLWVLRGGSELVTEDLTRLTGIAQLSNRVAFQGYQLVTRAGLRLSRWSFDSGHRQHSSAFFLSVIAGLR